MDRTNETWVGDLRRRDESALVDLREALLHGLRGGLSGRQRVDDSFLEDCVQESLLRVLDKLHQFNARSHFVTWATAIAIRVALAQMRRRRWRDVSLNDLASNAAAHGVEQVADAQALDALLHRRDLLEALRLSIHRNLTDRQRTALLAELKGMPQDEIARQLGSSRNALYKLTHDARKKLRASLEAKGFSSEDLAIPLAN